MTRLTLQLALEIIDGAFARAAEIKCVPLTVVVLDAGGHEVAVQRQDRSGILRVDIARAKAWGALGMGYSSREVGERAQKAPGFFAALASVAQGRMAPAAGAVLLHDEENNVIGAVGISGLPGEDDDALARRAIAAAGLSS